MTGHPPAAAPAGDIIGSVTLHRVVFVPCAPALLPGYRGLVDPLGDLRAATLAAVAWLVADLRGPVLVLSPATALSGAEAGTGPRGVALAEHLLAVVGHDGGPAEVASAADDVLPRLSKRAVLALADGSARRTERAPGYVDDRALPFDAAVGAALRSGDLAALRNLDVDLGAALLAEGTPVLRRLAHRLAGEGSSVEGAEMTYDDDPYGVQYWVARWQCRSDQPDACPT